MELLYAEEHCTCFNYEKEHGGAIEIRNMKMGDTWNMVSKSHKIIFMVKGCFRYKYEGIAEKEITTDQMLLFPSDVNFEAHMLEDTIIVLMRIPVTDQLCDTYSFEKLLFEGSENDVNTNKEILDMNERMIDYIRLLHAYVTEGLRCTYFFQLKVKELLFIFRAYYSKSELLRFFYPILTSDMTFSEFVMKNKHKVKTVKEFAEYSNYSLSGFQKRFKKVFGVSAHKWLNDHRSKSILHEINNSEKTLKEISNKYGFSSQSYFNDFCKTNFGFTPGQLRVSENEIIDFIERLPEI